LSVIIAGRNRPDVLNETIKRLGDQREAPPFEVIVVDDGSEPPLAPVIPPGLAALLLTRSHEERSSARNAGAAEAASPLLAFLDDDIGVPADFVRTLVRQHRRMPNAVIVGRIELPPEWLQTPFGRFRHALEECQLPDGASIPPTHAAAGNLSLPAAAFRQAGGFDPALTAGEDQDLAIRLVRMGLASVYARAPAGLHRDTADNIALYADRVERGARAMPAFLFKHPELPENQARLRVNSPPAPGRDPPGLLIRKSLKSFLGRSGPWKLLLELIGRMERAAPESFLLPRLYRLAIGIALYRGLSPELARRC